MVAGGVTGVVGVVVVVPGAGLVIDVNETLWRPNSCPIKLVNWEILSLKLLIMSSTLFVDLAGFKNELSNEDVELNFEPSL